MKFLHSPSSSSSATNYTATGCFPALLRRLLCFHTLPTLPFDHHIAESYGNDEFHELEGNPGIVAKLMGLDSMPAMDRCRGFGLQKGTCVNEVPSFVELENEKFIILSFEGGGKDKELGLKSSKTSKGLIEFKEKTRNKKNQEMPICKSPESDGKVMNSCRLFDFNKNSENPCDTEFSKRSRSRKKKLEEVDTDSDSENSSPVSVLEFSDHQEALHSGKQDSKPKNSNLRRELRADLEKNSPSPSSVVDESSRNGKNCVGLKKQKQKKKKKKNHHVVIEEFGEMWEEICKVAERDVMMDSTRERWKDQEFEEIVVNFELQILDHLILELFTIT
ncbi:uncharacterized protein LOC112505856 [Cynara cardunculus var. scolymus]|uniref:uncharacterized protein LOC112505856 n=1 Tax=Cynara cardunculus var. scolymus TaxID=59895 RepID=UPI000D62E04B|nr:uncharacterized protein LOC112505856 [Cynara cardunculus var. scolymus]